MSVRAARSTGRLVRVHSSNNDTVTKALPPSHMDGAAIQWPVSDNLKPQEDVLLAGCAASYVAASVPWAHVRPAVLPQFSPRMVPPWFISRKIGGRLTGRQAQLAWRIGASR